MLLTELENLSASSELISIDRNCHDEELTGIVCFVSDTVISMQLFSDGGFYRGFAVFEFDQVAEVYWGNREHRAIRHLIDQNSRPEPIVLSSTSFLESMLELNEKYSSVSIHSSNDEDRFDIAKIVSSDENWCKIQTFSAKRTLSPMTKIIKTELITRIVVESPYQNQIVELHSSEI